MSVLGSMVLWASEGHRMFKYTLGTFTELQLTKFDILGLV